MVRAKDPAVESRLFTNVYVCMKCNAKIRTGKLEKTKCRKCGSRALRLKNKEIKIVGA